MLLLAAVFVAALVVRPTGGHLSALAQVRLRLVPVVLGSLCLQVVIISVLPEGSSGLHRLLHVASYALAAAFLVANRRVRGMLIIALGAALNLVAILANDGVMPASRSALRAAGFATQSEGFANSAAVAHPRLLQLGDIFVVPKPWPLHNVFSIGDLCIAIGVMIAVLALSGSRLVTAHADSGRPSATLDRRVAAKADLRDGDATVSARRDHDRVRGHRRGRRRGRLESLG